MRVRCPECDVTLKVPADEAGRKIECPECGERFRVRPLDDDDDDRPRRSSKPARREKAAGTNTGALVGTAVAALVAAGAIIWVVAGRPKPQAPIPAPKDPEVAQNTTPVPNVPPVVRESPEALALAALFRQAVDAPPATRRLVKAEAAGAKPPPLQLPPFPAAKPPDPDAGKLSADELTAATAYIKVGTGDRMSTGSGFLVATVGGNGLVATNQHVIDDALDPPATPGEKPPGISVVFHSNVPGKELTLPATVVAVHPTADLAVLSVPGGGKLPAKPIDPFVAPPAVYSAPVRILGFPLGEHMARGGAHPDISVSPGSVSSLRRDKDGKLAEVQITGPLIFGNSGGPIVDADGRLVGVAVSTLLGTGLGFAVPVPELVDLLAGKFLPAAVVPKAVDGDTARFTVAVPFIDPLARVKRVHVLYRTTGGAGEPAKDDKTVHKLLDGAGRVDLALADGKDRRRTAAGELALPAATKEVVVQVVAEDARGAVVASPPVPYALAPGDVASGRDAGKFADFVTRLRADPAGLAGKPQVVRGKVVTRPDTRAPYQDVGVAGPDGRVPDGIKFMADREAAAQFDELDRDHEALEARLVLVPGGPWQDGTIPVRVARVDYLDEWDRPVKSIPGEVEADTLAALNRDPEQYLNRSVVVKAEAVLGLTRQGPEVGALYVLLPNRRAPRNLQFATTSSLAHRLTEEKFRLLPYPVRLGVTVGARRDKYSPAPLMVRKIEVLDPKTGEVVKTFE